MTASASLWARDEAIRSLMSAALIFSLRSGSFMAEEAGSRTTSRMSRPEFQLRVFSLKIRLRSANETLLTALLLFTTTATSLAFAAAQKASSATPRHTNLLIGEFTSSENDRRVSH